MAEIITGPFHMDEQGFLATIERTLSSGLMDTVLANILTELGKSTMNTVRSDLFRFFDEKVCELGKELFCSTSWVANLAWAMISFDYDLVEHDANFLDGCRNIVRSTV